jgi:hypothetical protein
MYKIGSFSQYHMPCVQLPSYDLTGVNSMVRVLIVRDKFAVSLVLAFWTHSSTLTADKTLLLNASATKVVAFALSNFAFWAPGGIGG